MIPVPLEELVSVWHLDGKAISWRVSATALFFFLFMLRGQAEVMVQELAKLRDHVGQGVVVDLGVLVTVDADQPWGWECQGSSKRSVAATSMTSSKLAVGHWDQEVLDVGVVEGHMGKVCNGI